MSFEPNKLDRHLADAIGPDAGLIAELRATFLASATRHVAALSQVTDAGPWRDEALRLQGLAASFGMIDLMRHAGEAARGMPDADLLERIAIAIGACR